ncbi:MAG TPA: CsbD family protein [Chroococcales cyanobacterium]
MNWDQIKGDWKTFTGKAKSEWAKLTDDDFQMIDGKREELCGRLQKHYGDTKEQAEKKIDNFIASL